MGRRPALDELVEVPAGRYEVGEPGEERACDLASLLIGPQLTDQAKRKILGGNLARLHGIDASEIIAIGDDLNDVPMIQNAGLGVAMGNARPEVKAIAKRVIGSNQDEGLAEFLEERLSWETFAELTFRSRLGATVERTGIVVPHVGMNAIGRSSVNDG